MTIASFEDTWRVRLLSMPQQRQAATTSNAWGESEAPPGCQERSTPPTTMATMPSTMCRSAFSLKTTHAITAVSTPRSEEHTSELQSPCNIVCRLLLGKTKTIPKL